MKSIILFLEIIIIIYLHASDFNPDLLDIAMVKSYVSSMKQEFIIYILRNTHQKAMS